MLKTVMIVVAYIKPADGKCKVELEKAVAETSKLLDNLVQTNRTLSWNVKSMAGTGEQNEESL